MSIESLLLVAFLIVIPLLERLIRVLRAGTREAPADLARVPAPQRSASMSRPLPLPEEPLNAFEQPEVADLRIKIALPTPAPLPAPAQRHPEAERITSSARARARRWSHDLPAAPALVGPAADGRGYDTSLSGISAELRRAIVLMTILGPCKALDDEGGHAQR